MSNTKGSTLTIPIIGIKMTWNTMKKNAMLRTRRAVSTIVALAMF